MRKILKSNDLILTLSFIIGSFIAVLFACFSSFAKDCEKAPTEVFRFHILANSNSEDDQRLKYDLRDFILDEFGCVFGEAENLAEAELIAEQNLSLISEKSNSFIKSRGYDYTVKAETTNAFFTTRVYPEPSAIETGESNNGFITMPAGNYQTLRLTIGDGEGKNWWCVMFPQLCLPAATKSEDAAVFTPETSAIVESGSKNKQVKVKVKFKVYEWFKKITK